MNVSGMGMLIKAIGIDPDEIARVISESKSDIQAAATKMDRRVTAIENNLLTIEQKLDFLISILTDQKAKEIDEEVGNIINNGDSADSVGMSITIERNTSKFSCD
jgi:hypothetical protein